MIAISRVGRRKTPGEFLLLFLIGSVPQEDFEDFWKRSSESKKVQCSEK